MPLYKEYLTFEIKANSTLQISKQRQSWFSTIPKVPKNSCYNLYNMLSNEYFSWWHIIKCLPFYWSWRSEDRNPPYKKFTTCNHPKCWQKTLLIWQRKHGELLREHRPIMITRDSRFSLKYESALARGFRLYRSNLVHKPSRRYHFSGENFIFTQLGENFAMGGAILTFLPWCIASLMCIFNGDKHSEPGIFRRFQEKEIILACVETLLLREQKSCIMFNGRSPHSV